MFNRATELLASHYDPPQIPMGGMLIGEGDSSEALQCPVRHVASCPRTVCLCDRRRLERVVLFLVERGRRVQHARP